MVYKIEPLILHTFIFPVPSTMSPFINRVQITNLKLQSDCINEAGHSARWICPSPLSERPRWLHALSLNPCQYFIFWILIIISNVFKATRLVPNISLHKTCCKYVFWLWVVRTILPLNSEINAKRWWKHSASQAASVEGETGTGLGYWKRKGHRWTWMLMAGSLKAEQLLAEGTKDVDEWTDIELS